MSMDVTSDPRTRREIPYFRHIREARKEGDTTRAVMIEGHRQLEVVAGLALRGIDSPKRVARATAKLSTAAELAAEKGDVSTQLRIQTILPFVDLMVFSPVINLATLSDAQARNVKTRFDFAETYDGLCRTAENTLVAYEALAEQQWPTHSEVVQRQDLVGLLEEQTYLLLMLYPKTAMEYATPSLHYDDAFSLSGRRIDALTYDNRATREIPSRGVQIKHRKRQEDIEKFHRDIALIDGSDLGNDYRSDKWGAIPGKAVDYRTLRTLINGHLHGITEAQHMSNIERIRRNLLKRTNSNMPGYEEMTLRLGSEAMAKLIAQPA